MPKKLSRTAEKAIQLAPNLTDEEIAELIRSTDGWRNVVAPKQVEERIFPADPSDFMEKILGYTMWPKLKVICDAVRDNHNVVVESGFGVGKSITAAAIACWFLISFNPSTVITLAPTWSQVNSILWLYIRQVGRKSKLPGTILETPRWNLSDTQKAYGLSPRKSSDQDMASLQGRHSENQLVILDEAAGLPEKVWQTVMGLSVSENNKVLTIGNPISTAGPFYNATISPNWSHVRISCFEHPNITEGKELIPGAVSRQWIEDRSTEWAVPCDEGTPGAVHLWWKDQWVSPQPLFISKILGIPVEEAEDQLIKTEWVMSAENREAPQGEFVVLSCDPAPRAGDDTAMAARSGSRILWLKRRKTSSTNEIIQWIKTEVSDNLAVRVYVDETGSGIGVVDECRMQGIPVAAVNSSRSAIQKRRFSNVRSEMWWNLREALRRGEIQIPKDTLLEGDLTAVRIDRNEIYGRLQLESKDDTHARIGRSPDSGDAIALLYTLPNAGTEIDVERMQGVLAKGAGGRSISRWGITRVYNGNSRWKK